MEYTIGTKVFGDWKIAAALGEGAYGKVFEIHKETEYGGTSKAALKVIRVPQSDAELRAAPAGGTGGLDVMEYFRGVVKDIIKEINIMESIKSSMGIVSCEDSDIIEHVGSFGWDILIRMELLTSLQEYQEKHRMEEDEVLHMAQNLCGTLMFCEKKGIIHRDIKPGNIFVNEEGDFKLGDFGVARTLERTTGGFSGRGTESYMAPEVYLSKPYGTSVDMYSLGLVLYQALNDNRLPFMPPAPQPIRISDRENALNRRVMKGEPLPAPRLASTEFAKVILKACAWNPDDRYRTAAEMLEEINRIVANRMPGTAGQETALMERRQEWEKIYEEYYLKVFSHIKRKINSAHDAEDMTQEVFLSCFAHFDTYDAERVSISTWLYVIMNNRLKNFYRDKKEQISIDSVEFAEELSEKLVEEAVLFEEKKAILYDAVSTLPERERKIIFEKFFYRKKSEEIAGMLGITAGNVRIILNRALKKLHDYMVKHKYE